MQHLLNGVYENKDSVLQFFLFAEFIVLLTLCTAKRDQFYQSCNHSNSHAAKKRDKL